VTSTPRRGPARAAAALRDITADTWVTGSEVLRGGLAKFTHVIRGPDDPERTDIRKLPEAERDRLALWRHGLKRRPFVELRAPILDHLRDGVARTFNRVGVELFDKTADLLLDLPPDAALWSLVGDGLVEHTLAAPVLFRATAAGLAATPEVVATPSAMAVSFAFAPTSMDEHDDDGPESTPP